MATQLNKKYGLLTAICTVVGTVIGSGVFFKAEKILTETGGNLPVGILAWIIGGIIMVVCAYAFSILATKHEKVSGIVDYAEAMCGKKYAYFMGWFLAVFYYPTLTSVLAWVSARYLCVFINAFLPEEAQLSIAGPQCMTIAGVLLIAIFFLNAIAPKIAGKFQISATFIKLIPLFLMAIVGTIKGLTGDGLLIQNFQNVVNEDISTSSGLFKAVVATAFAYEGWICATSINAELRDAKKNLPKALVMGTLIIVAVYITYYIGLAGGIENKVIMDGGEAGARIAFSSVFGNFAGVALFLFVVISCLGTLNGLTLGCSRAFHAIAARNMGPKPEIFKQVDSATNMPVNSSMIGLLISGFWLLYFYGANLDTAWFGLFSFDSSELPIITTYAMYIPIFISMFIKSKDLGVVKGKIAPVLAIFGSIFMVVAAIFAHGIYPYQAAQADGKFSLPVLFYLITYAVLMIIGAFFMKNKKKS
ncbi:MAG: APC family permease [Ruminococcaceae bacterium]|nr:APC family permease [Oscillospiraceae bacterium]